MYKYASLVFELSPPRFSDLEQPFDLGNNIFISTRKKSLGARDSEFWEKELGRSVWAEIDNGNDLMLSKECYSENPEILDGENEILKNDLYNAFRIIPLVGEIRGPFVRAHIFTGKGRSEEGVVTVEDVREVGLVDSWIRSFYQESKWDEYYERYSNTLANGCFLQSWKEVLGKCQNEIFCATPKHQLLEAFRSFEAGMQTVQLEFKIPFLVRCMESIFASWGVGAFIDRFMHLLSPNPEYFGYESVESLRLCLKDLYHLRNDCMHGKPISDSFIRNHGRELTGDDIATLEYLAEWGSRRVLIGTLTNQSLLDVVGNYEDTRSAWATGAISPNATYISTVC